MKIILKKDIESLGAAGEIVTVIPASTDIRRIRHSG